MLYLDCLSVLFLHLFEPKNRDSFQLFYTSIARSQMTFLKNWDQHHADLTRRSPELSSDLPFEDPPFNQRQKIMGWFSPTLVTTVKVPRKQDNIYMDEYRPQEGTRNNWLIQHFRSIYNQLTTKWTGVANKYDIVQPFCQLSIPVNETICLIRFW